jgi:hypothetical protein
MKKLSKQIILVFYQLTIKSLLQMLLDKIVLVTEMGCTDKIVFYDTIQAQLT